MVGLCWLFLISCSNCFTLVRVWWFRVWMQQIKQNTEIKRYRVWERKRKETH